MAADIETVVRLFAERWTERHGDQIRSMPVRNFQNAVAAALGDAIGDASIDFADALADDETDDGYGTVLILSERRLLTIRAADDATFYVAFLGELPGGRYDEQVIVEDEVVGRTIRYAHPRLPAGEFEFSVRGGVSGRRFDTLRALLREWSTGDHDR